MAFVLAAATGCGAAAGSGSQPCTLIAAQPGVSVDVAPRVASKTSGEGTLEVCWAGQCRSRDVSLRGSTKPAEPTCRDDSCSAQLTPTGRERAFVQVSGLPAKPVRVTLTLRGSGGESVVRETLRVAPEKVHPNGRDCGGGATQADLVVGPSGDVRER